MKIIKTYVDQDYQDHCLIDFESKNIYGSSYQILRKMTAWAREDLGCWGMEPPSRKELTQGLKQAVQKTGTIPEKAVMRVLFTCTDAGLNWSYIAWAKEDYYADA